MMYAGDEVYGDDVTSGIEVEDEDCPHNRVERDDDGLNARFFVCIDCNREVRYSGPDEDGHVEWEVVD